MCFFQSDPRYRRFLAEHPGIWGEVGVFDDPRFFSVLVAERQALGLPRRPRAPARSRPRRYRSRSAELRVAWGFVPPYAEVAS